MLETSEAVLWMWKQKQRQSIEGVVVTESKYNQASKKIVYHLTGVEPTTAIEDGEILTDDDELPRQKISEIPSENVVQKDRSVFGSVKHPNVTVNSKSGEALVEQTGAYVNNFRHRQDMRAWTSKSQKGINIQAKNPATKEKVHFKISPVFGGQNFPPADVTSSVHSGVRKSLVYEEQLLDFTENVESSKQPVSGAVPSIASDPLFESSVQDFLSKCRQDNSSLNSKDFRDPLDTVEESLAIADNNKASKRKSRKRKSLKGQDEIISKDNPLNKNSVKSKPRVKSYKNLLSQFEGNQKKRKSAEPLQAKDMHVLFL